VQVRGSKTPKEKERRSARVGAGLGAGPHLSASARSTPKTEVRRWSARVVTTQRLRVALSVLAG
jgi:hypothetical protein